MSRDLHKIEKQLIYLHSLKGDQLLKKDEREAKYRLAEKVNPDPYKSYYPTNITFSVIQGKMSEIASGIQDYDFIPLDNDAEKNISAFKYVWKYEWLKSNTDSNIYKAFLSALKHGDGYLYEGTRRIERTISVPSGKTEDGLIQWSEKKILEWDGIYQEYIPVDCIYHDGTSIADANEVIWIKQWDRTHFINSFKDNPNYYNVSESLPIGRYYYINGNEMDVNGNLKDEETISELRYYNKSKDKFIVLANGIEVYESPIPYKHKELPFIQAIDIFLEDRVYNLGEYELLEKDEAFKTAIRGLKVDAVKYSAGVTFIDPDTDFDAGALEFGPGKYELVDPKAVAFYAPNINSSILIEAENKADEDIIIKSGHDFRNQLLSADETAEKTRSKKESARKRINLMLKQNVDTFFGRLAKLRMSNIQEEYSDGEKKISVKGATIGPDGVMRATKGGYGTFTVKPEYVKGQINIIPITNSILGDSTEKDLEMAIKFLDKAGNMMGEDGKPIINNEKTVKWLAKKFRIDIEDIYGRGEANKSPEEIMRELDSNTKGISTDSLDPTSPNFVPPEQRSGAMSNVPITGGI